MFNVSGGFVSENVQNVSGGDGKALTNYFELSVIMIIGLNVQ